MPTARRIRTLVLTPGNSRANTHTGSSEAASGTTCRRKLRGSLPERSSRLTASDYYTSIVRHRNMYEQNGANQTLTNGAQQLEVAVLAGGCFWGVEELLREV